MSLVNKSATIIGMGAYIPEEVRTNDFWPSELVNMWGKGNKKSKTFLHLKNEKAYKQKNTHPLLEQELNRLLDDPFVGMKERRVSNILPSEMEKLACEEALMDANVSPEEIDLMIGFSLPSDKIYPTNLFKVHYELGLKNAKCFGVDTLCYSFLTMLDIAYQYIRNGEANKVLLFVSTKYSAIMDYSSSVSVVAGDGSVAVVLDSCNIKNGIQKFHHFNDTKFYDSIHAIRRPPLRCQTPDFSFGESQSMERIFFTINNSQKSREMVLRIPYWGEDVKRRLFGKNGDFSPKDISLLLTNSAFVWYSRVLAEIFNIPIEKVEDNILKFSNMGAVNLPMNLYTAYKNGRLKDGDVIMFFGHGGGASYGGGIFKWYKKNN